MKVSLNWLREYVDIELPAEELADKLTMTGLEVESLEPLGHGLNDIIAAKIISIERHPQADRLSICHVDTGRDQLPVICGAPNIEPGLLVPMALPGIRLPNGMKIAESRIRGEKSVGMLLAEDEMGLTDDHTGIMSLPGHTAPGTSLYDALPLEDWTLDIAITPNRPDCASIIGVAREVAAMTGRRLKMPQIHIHEDDRPIDELTSVTLDDPTGCPRYAAGLIMGVELKPSPFWMRYRLQACGVRAINNVVDVSNYILLEMGQPLHAFDYDRLQENRIVVRRAREGDSFTTLDGKTHAMTGEHLMICDGQRPVALAGIMGGLNSEIFEGSVNVLVESAYFDPITIRRGAKGLGISTEASYRFERGIDIDGVIRALKRALMLISDLAGGKILKGIIDQYPSPYAGPVIDLRIDKTNQFLGTDIPRDTVAGYLKALEMDVEQEDENVLRVKPPSFRVDLLREVDLMEEVARLEGYDRIPVTYPAIRPTEEGDIIQLVLGDRVRDIMAGLGFTEIITYSFISPGYPDIFGAEEDSPMRAFVNLRNPLSVEQSVMRTSLLPGLLNTVNTSISHGEENLKLFEWGKIFLRSGEDELPHERLTLSAVMTGLNRQNEWYQGGRTVDFYDIKGVVETLLKALGVDDMTFQKGNAPPGYESDAVAFVHLAEKCIGHLGEISGQVLDIYDIKEGKTFVFELDIEALLEKLPEKHQFEPFTKFPAVFRDISLVLEKNIESKRLEQIIEEEGGKLVESVRLFDLYEGKTIAPSERALTYRVCYRSKDGTLDGKQVNHLHDAIIHRIIKKTGARLREG
ncbi:MAG: phenylalanine--tRNA ligase subunit beta [Deltaproteobacteria bacterium]|nr:phenylalanine--tRNA ligase subunit beta [Deltaproteobacteria bacterium]